MPAASKSRPSPRTARRNRLVEMGPANASGHRRLSRTWVLSLVLAAVLAAATFATYYPSLKHPFVNYDDVDYVVENPRVHQGLTLETVDWALTSTDQDNWHPLTWLSHALDYDLFGLDASGHHFTSLLFHAANSVLLFFLLLWVTGTQWPSFFVAALFALHPLNVESVAWVAERKTVLSMFFLLLTLTSYARYAKKTGWARFLLVCALFAAALAAKPMVVTVPFLLLLWDIWPLQRVSFRDVLLPSSAFPVPQFPPRRLIMEKLPLFALSAASCGITLLAQRSAMKPTALIPFSARVVNAGFSYCMYLWKAFWPLRLGVFYAPQGSRLPAWQMALTMAFLAGVSALVWRKRSRLYLLIGWLWFLGTLVPMIGLVQVGEQGMADRYAYLPLIGIFIMLVWGLDDLASACTIVWQRAVIAVGCAVLLLLAWQTRRQLRSWESSYALWSHSLAITPENYVAEDFVGSTLLEAGYKANGQRCTDEALAHFQNAVRINPLDTLGHVNIGFCRQAQGRLPEAIEEYKAGVQSARNQFLRSRALLNLGSAYQESNDFAASRQAYNQALQIYPHDPDILNGVAKLDAWEKIAELTRSAAQHPDAVTYFQLGQLQAEMGRVDEARKSFQGALSLEPKFSQAQTALHELDNPHP